MLLVLKTLQCSSFCGRSAHPQSSDQLVPSAESRHETARRAPCTLSQYL
jgi:hypothetical protein